MPALLTCITKTSLEPALVYVAPGYEPDGHASESQGKADLVFVLVEAAHPLYERVGADLWLRITQPPPPPASLFCGAVVPTLRLQRNWLGPLKREGGADVGAALAAANCLAAALGFDRSGWCEALV